MTNMEEMNKQLASPTLPKTLLAVPLFHISGLLSRHSSTSGTVVRCT